MSHNTTNVRSNDVARAAGRIMDFCWAPDTVSGGHAVLRNGNLRVHISKNYRDALDG
jgi:hypothetical protein